MPAVEDHRFDNLNEGRETGNNQVPFLEQIRRTKLEEALRDTLTENR
jgi:hypothetical protein